MNYYDVLNETKTRLRTLDTPGFVQFVQQMKRVPQFSLMNTTLIAQHAPGATEVGTAAALNARGITVDARTPTVTILKPQNGSFVSFVLHDVYAVTAPRETRVASNALFNFIRSGLHLPVGRVSSRPHATNGKTVWVNPDQDIHDVCLSLVTAWAHAHLHFGEHLEWARENADIARFEARVTAYVVLGAFGVHTPDGEAEFTELALHGSDLYESLNAIKNAVSAIWKAVQNAVRTGTAPALDAA